jgi:hypothetical protein
MKNSSIELQAPKVEKSYLKYNEYHYKFSQSVPVDTISITETFTFFIYEDLRILSHDQSLFSDFPYAEVVFIDKKTLLEYIHYYLITERKISPNDAREILVPTFQILESLDGDY